MEIPCGNFFQVTINSNKLYSFILEINKQIHTLELKTDELAKSVATISSTLAQRLNRVSEQAEVELEKIRRSNQEENNYLRLYMKDADKKTGEKLEELQNSIVLMSNRICRTKEELEEDVSIKLSYLEKKIANSPALAEVERNFNEQLKNLQIHLECMQQRQDRVDLTLENDLKKTVQFNEDMLQKIKVTEIQRKNQSQKLLSLGNSFREGVTSRSRKRLKTHRAGTLFENNEDMSNIVQKIEEFQQKLQQTDQAGSTSHSKIVKTTENIIKIGSRNNLAVSQREIKQKQFEQLITSKLERIEEIAHRKVFQLEKDVSKNANKHEIVDEHISILSRKIEKEKTRIHDLAQSIKRFEEKKIDERVIEGLKAAIKKLSKEFEEGLELKLNREVYEKEKSRISERIFFLSEMVTQKAEKSQVKKGFTFFQEKIKEIIIVLAEQRNSAKDGAGKRMPFKCLSCDKQLQIAADPNCRLSHNNSTNSRNSIRCSTNQIRKRIRVVNNSLIPSEE